MKFKKHKISITDTPLLFICRPVLILVLITITSALCAQSFFVKGFIINPEGDTTKGYVKNKTDLRNAQHVEFKQDSSGNGKEFFPDELRGYSIENKRTYVSKEVAFVIFNNAGDKLGKKRIFAELLIKGKCNLYYTADPTKKNHYYIETDSTKGLVELTEKLAAYFDEYGKKKRLTRPYIETFNHYFKDCSTWEKKSKIPYSEKGFVNAVFTYNNCGNDSANNQTLNNTYSALKERNKFEIFYSVFAGINSSTVSTNDYYFYRHYFNRRRVGFMGGLSVNIYYPRANKSTSIEVDLLYNQKGVNGKSSGPNFNQDFLSLIPKLKYTYRRGPLQPYAAVGLSMGAMLSTKDIKDYFGSTIMPHTHFIFESGLLVEGGFLIPLKNQNKISLGIRYEKTDYGPISIAHTYYKNMLTGVRVGYVF